MNTSIIYIVLLSITVIYLYYKNQKNRRDFERELFLQKTNLDNLKEELSKVRFSYVKLQETSVNDVISELARYVVIPRASLENADIEIELALGTCIERLKELHGDWESDGYYYVKKVNRETKQFFTDKYIFSKNKKDVSSSK